MIDVAPKKTEVDSLGTVSIPETISSDSDRGAIEAARLEFEALPPDSDSEARKTAFIHLIVSKGFWSRRAAKIKADSESKPNAT